jgi:Skp family chaperone for outer membrane proteins
MQTENIVHNESKEFLIRKHKSLIQDIASWEQRYATDVGKMDNEIEKITLKRKNLLEKLTHLQNRKQGELEDEINAKAVAAAARKAQKEAERLTRRQNKAARCIQKTIRHYIKRCKEHDAIYGGGKKGKGKGKGKGGKGKKGKK